jgi:hypothetical protein
MRSSAPVATNQTSQRGSERPVASPTSVPTPEALSSAPGDGGTVSACAMITNRQSRGVS